MKTKIITLAAMLIAGTGICVHGQGLANVKEEVLALQAKQDTEFNDSILSVADPLYEWSQYKEKNRSALITKNVLTLESKVKDASASSIIDLNFSPETDNFVFGIPFCGPKLSDELNVGIVFDYEDSRNYKGISISKSQYQYFTVKDGVTATVKNGLIKTKGAIYNLKLERQGDLILFYLNDLEYAKLNRIKLSSSYMGAFINGKGKTSIPFFIFKLIQPEGDTEESTSNT